MTFILVVAVENRLSVDQGKIGVQSVTDGTTTALGVANTPLAWLELSWAGHRMCAKHGVSLRSTELLKSMGVSG